MRVDGVLACPQLSGTAPALRTPEAAGYRSVILHGQGVSPWHASPDAPLALERLGSDPVLLQLFLRGNPFRGGQDTREPWRAAVLQLQQLNRLAGLVVYGSPYLWEELSAVLNPAVPAAYSPGQMPEAQHQVLNKLFGGALAADTAAANTTAGADFTD